MTFAAAADGDTVAALARSTGVRLTVVSRLLPATYVLDLAATADCNVALQRLRAAAGVRAAEPDTRRHPLQG